MTATADQPSAPKKPRAPRQPEVVLVPPADDEASTAPDDEEGEEDEDGKGAGTVIQTKIIHSKGRKPKVEVANKEALEALRALGTAQGARIVVERVEPRIHGGRRVSTGKLVSYTLAPDELRDEQVLLPALGRRGSVMRLHVGKESVTIKLAGAALDLLDYEEPQAQAVTFDAFGRPVAQVMPAGAQMPVTLPFATPYGFNAQPQVDIAKVVADAIAAVAPKRDEAREKLLLELEMKKAEREERDDRTETEADDRVDGGNVRHGNR
jgi:hypothetical protein